MPFASLLRQFSNDLAIDLGTANTLVYARNRRRLHAVRRRSAASVGRARRVLVYERLPVERPA